MANGSSTTPSTAWPQSAPSEDEQHVISVVCGNSHMHWAFHNSVADGLSPQLFWRTPHLRSTDIKDGTVSLSRHLPVFVHEFLFGVTNGMSSPPTFESARKAAEGRAPLRVFIVSARREQTELLTSMWSSVPSAVALMQGEDFFTKSEGRYDNMGVDRLAALRGAGELYGFPALVFDGGTATTYTAADAKGNVLGGGIGPGLKVKFKSLQDYTDALPNITPDEVLNRVKEAIDKNKPLPTFAKNTTEAILVDVLSEVAFKTRRVIMRWLNVVGDKNSKSSQKGKSKSGDESSEPGKTSVTRNVVITGGDGEVIWELCKKASSIVDSSPGDEVSERSILENCSVVLQKNLIHYGVTAVLMKQIASRQQAIEQKEKVQKAAERHGENAKFLGQRIAKDFGIPSSDGSSIFRGVVTGIQRSGKSQGPNSDGPGEDWYLIKYDDGDREHATLDELKEMIALFEKIGEKDEGAGNRQKKTVQSEQQKKPAAASDEKKRKAKASEPEEDTKPVQQPPIKRTKKEVPQKKKRRAVKLDKAEDYIGKKVAKMFDDEVFFGVVTEYFPDTANESGYWHVEYEDGDEEDYDENEVVSGLKLFKKTKNLDDPEPDEDIMVDDASTEMNNSDDVVKTQDKETKANDNNDTPESSSGVTGASDDVDAVNPSENNNKSTQDENDSSDDEVEIVEVTPKKNVDKTSPEDKSTESNSITNGQTKPEEVVSIEEDGESPPALAETMRDNKKGSSISDNVTDKSEMPSEADSTKRSPSPSIENGEKKNSADSSKTTTHFLV